MGIRGHPMGTPDVRHRRCGRPKEQLLSPADPDADAAVLDADELGDHGTTELAVSRTTTSGCHRSAACSSLGVLAWFGCGRKSRQPSTAWLRRGTFPASHRTRGPMIRRLPADHYRQEVGGNGRHGPLEGRSVQPLPPHEPGTTATARRAASVRNAPRRVWTRTTPSRQPCPQTDIARHRDRQRHTASSTRWGRVRLGHRHRHRHRPAIRCSADGATCCAGRR